MYFKEYGLVLDREFFGTLTATLIPPSLAVCVNILETILAVKQGVKSVSCGYAEQGNRWQDIAAIRAIRNLVPEYLISLGLPSIQVNTVFHQYMAAFPNDEKLSRELIYQSAITGGLSALRVF